jgi:hypothetical protein
MTGTLPLHGQYPRLDFLYVQKLQKMLKRASSSSRYDFLIACTESIQILSYGPRKKITVLLDGIFKSVDTVRGFQNWLAAEMK